MTGLDVVRAPSHADIPIPPKAIGLTFPSLAILKDSSEPEMMVTIDIEKMIGIIAKSHAEILEAMKERENGKEMTIGIPTHMIAADLREHFETLIKRHMITAVLQNPPLNIRTGM
jgi:deoxyhypusine synthase